jgi:hypothetical protein
MVDIFLTLFQNNHKNKVMFPSTDANLLVRVCLELYCAAKPIYYDGHSLYSTHTHMIFPSSF